MGGDLGADMVIPGVEVSLKRHPQLRVLLYGDENKVKPILYEHPLVKGRSNLIHTDVWVEMDAKPSQALLRGRRVSSMWLALEAVPTLAPDSKTSPFRQESKSQLILKRIVETTLFPWRY